MQINTLITDDSLVFRKILGKALKAIQGVNILGEASSGEATLDFIQNQKPHLITLDLEMPGIGGLETLKKIRQNHPDITVVMVSAHTQRGANATMKCLEEGAFSFITKPDGGTPDSNLTYLESQLRFIVTSLTCSNHFTKTSSTITTSVSPVKTPTLTGISPKGTELSSKPKGFFPEILAIGVSTGGPKALADFLPNIKSDIPVPILICQHMPPLFTASLAETLNKKCPFEVKEGQDREVIKKGVAYIAPGGKHMKVEKDSNTHKIHLVITEDPPENNCRPSVDYLFRSISLQYPNRCIGVILTGMGKDGTLGLKEMKKNGDYVIAQDEQSCVVFGMPKEAIHQGVVDCVLPLQEIAPKINTFFK